MKDKLKRISQENHIINKAIEIAFYFSRFAVGFICIILRIFPIKHNKIVCSSWKGSKCSDNPYYISKQILEKYNDVEIIWLINKNYNGKILDGVIRKKNNIWVNLYELATAKVWIDCNWKPYGLLKRKNQLYVQTWHGSYGLKKIYMDIPEKLQYMEKKLMQHNSQIIDVMISNSMQTSTIYRRALRYNGPMLEVGSPRNDIFFSDCKTIKCKVKKVFHIEGKKIILYAPTYRNSLKINQFNLDFNEVIDILKKKFGGEWVFLIRLHPYNVYDAGSFITYTDNIINASYYDDMQELLVASDILITDYSSCMFDFVTNRKKCFLFATDVDEYKNERDYYFELDDLPFPLATNSKEMQNNILDFDEKKYQRDLDKLFKQVGLFETGKASEVVADYVINWMENN